MKRLLVTLAGVVLIAACQSDSPAGPMMAPEIEDTQMVVLKQRVEAADLAYQQDPSAENLASLQAAEAELEATFGPDPAPLVARVVQDGPTTSLASVNTGTATYTWTGSALVPPVGTAGTTVVTLSVPDGGEIVDVDVLINTLYHTWDGDLDVFVISPAGTSPHLAARRGGSSNDYLGTVFDDEAAVPISWGSAPFTGSFQPETPLSVLDGEDMAGDWQLRIVDNAFWDQGSLQSWALRITYVAQDETPPTVTASLTPVADKSVKSKKGQFTVGSACEDDVDPEATLTATLNGISVEDGQVVDLRLKSEKSNKSNKSAKSQKSEKSEKSGKSQKPVKIEGTAAELVLIVECIDESGNVGMATAAPEFVEKSKKSKKG